MSPRRLVSSGPPALLGIFTLLALVSPVSAQSPAATAVVEVRVVDQSGGAVTDAEVLVAQGARASRSADAVEPGRYVLSGLSARAVS